MAHTWEREQREWLLRLQDMLTVECGVSKDDSEVYTRLGNTGIMRRSTRNGEK